MNIYCADIHLTDKQPINRITPVQPEGLELFSKIVELAIHGKLILGGDLFEYPCPSLGLLNQVISILKTAKEQGTKVFAVYGNHDLVYGDMQSNNNALSILMNLNLVYPLETIHGVDRVATCSTVFGINYRKELYTDIAKVAPVAELSGVSTVVTHQFLSPKALPFKHVLLSDFIVPAGVKHVLCSHLHTPFMETVGKTLFINPGCICRLNRNEATIDPSVIAFDETKADEFCNPRIVSLGAEPVEFLEAENKKAEFVRSIDDAKVEVQDITSYITGQDALPEVKDAAIKLIQKHSN